jgi:hypothetical protein
MNGDRYVLYILLFAMLMLSGCSCKTDIWDDGQPTSRIIIKQDNWNNCENTEPLPRNLTTSSSVTRETTWWLEGKTGLGGKIPVGFLKQELDINATLTGHYEQKTTQTWQETSSIQQNITAGGNFYFITFYKEVTRHGIVQACGKRIEYDFPAELTVAGTSAGYVDCYPGSNVIIYCLILPDTPIPTLPPGYEGIVRTWRRYSPKDGEILTMDVELEGATLLFHIRTDCASGPCDWGYATGCVWASPIQATFTSLFYKTTTLTIQSVSSDELRMEVRDHFYQPPLGVSDQVTDYILR